MQLWLFWISSVRLGLAFQGTLSMIHPKSSRNPPVLGLLAYSRAMAPTNVICNSHESLLRTCCWLAAEACRESSPGMVPPGGDRGLPGSPCMLAKKGNMPPSRLSACFAVSGEPRSCIH